MTVSEQIIQVLNALCEKFGIAVNWAGENVIPYIEVLCKKLVSYEIGTSIAWIVLMFVFSIASIVVTKKLAPTFNEGMKEDKKNYDCGWYVGAGFSIVGLIGLNSATIAVVFKQIMDIIQCITFPEMYVFEYISKLIAQ